MSSEDKSWSPGPTKEKDRLPKKEDKSLNFVRCPRHGISYPRGGGCPACASGK